MAISLLCRLTINMLIFCGTESFKTVCDDFQTSPGAIFSRSHLIFLKPVIWAVASGERKIRAIKKQIPENERRRLRVRDDYSL